MRVMKRSWRRLGAEDVRTGRCCTLHAQRVFAIRWWDSQHQRQGCKAHVCPYKAAKLDEHLRRDRAAQVVYAFSFFGRLFSWPTQGEVKPNTPNEFCTGPRPPPSGGFTIEAHRWPPRESNSRACSPPIRRREHTRMPSGRPPPGPRPKWALLGLGPTEAQLMAQTQR